MKKTLKTALVILICIATISATMLMASAVGTPTAKVKAVTYNSVSLYWTAVSGADYYQIQRKTSTTNWVNLSTAYTGTSYTDTKSLVTGTIYGYRVRAVDKGLFGKLTYGAWTSMVVAKPLPAQVTGLRVSAANHTAVQLTWNKVAGATGYTVQFLNGNKWQNYRTLTGNVLVVGSLTLGRTYSFRVLAYRTVSKSSFYGTASAVLKTGPVLLAPAKVVLPAVTATAVKIQWSAVSGAKGYEVYNYDTKTWVNRGASTFALFTNLKPGSKHQYKVRAYSGSLKGKETATYTFQTNPSVPANLKAASATDKSITFTWDKSEGALGYQYQYYNHSTKKWSNGYTTTSNTVTVSGLTGNTTYGFKVRAYIANTNVYNISQYAFSNFAPTIAYKTVLPASTLTVTGADSSTINLKWTAVSGARGYVLEKYDASRSEWFVYDFNASQWKSASNLTENSVTETTALSLADKGASGRSDLYRVSAVDATGRKCTPSAEVFGYTTNVFVGSAAHKNGTHAFDIQQIIRFPKVNGATSYRVYTRTPITEVYVDLALGELVDKGTHYQAALYMAPKSIHSIMVIGMDSAGKTLSSATNWLTFKLGEIPMYASNHKYYNISVNSQLLYAVRAINNTKAYKGELTVKNNSVLSYSINSLKIPLFLVNLKTPEEVEAYFKKYESEGETLDTNSSEVYNATLVFNEGSAKNDEGRTVYLKTYLEPSANSTKTAYLYNSKNYVAWRNGITNVKTVKNADGGYTISFTIKQEGQAANYHNGFISSLNAIDFGAADGFNMENFRVGASNIKVTVGPDGLLKAFNASSPYSATFKASFVSGEDSSIASMEMGMAGSNIFNYSFTK